MLPETSFHELGKTLMFVVVGNTVYHTENAAPADDFMYLCGLTFPLRKSETLRDLEKRYMSRNSGSLQAFKAAYAKSVVPDENLIARIDSEAKANINLLFFITEVIPAYCNETSKKRKEKKQEAKAEKTEEGCIFEELLGGNAAVINRRVYPLNEVGMSSIVRLDWKNYCFDWSRMTIDALESEFQSHLQERLKKEVLDQIKYSEDSKKRLSGLEKRTRDLVTKGHVIIVGNCYEYGNIGYDPQTGRVYQYCTAHYNRTTSRSYREREVAISVLLNPKWNPLDTKIIARNSSGFHIEYGTPCLGRMPGGSKTHQVIGSLAHSVANVNEQKAFHE